VGLAAALRKRRRPCLIPLVDGLCHLLRTSIDPHTSLMMCRQRIYSMLCKLYMAPLAEGMTPLAEGMTPLAEG